MNIKTFNFDDKFQDILKNNLKSILAEYDCEQILMPIFTCVNELIINAVKANYKNIYFENYNSEIDSIEIFGYETALKLFKMELTSSRIKTLRRIAKNNDKAAIVEASIENGNLDIRVTNPFPMTKIENKNVIDKISESKKDMDIMDYFSKSSNDPLKEGAGLGLIFVGMMLNSLGLDISNITITSDESSTTALLHIPLNKNTVESYIKNTANNNALPNTN